MPRTKQRIALILLAAITCITAMSAERAVVSARDASARTEILKLLKERRDAFHNADIAKFATFETDDFTRISEDDVLRENESSVRESFSAN